MKRVPIRTCIACRTKRPKRELLRIVRTPAGEIVIDPRGRIAGRGAYVCPRQECCEGVFEGRRLSAALKTTVTPETIVTLRQQLEQLGLEE